MYDRCYSDRRGLKNNFVNGLNNLLLKSVNNKLTWMKGKQDVHAINIIVDKFFQLKWLSIIFIKMVLCLTTMIGLIMENTSTC